MTRLLCCKASNGTCVSGTSETPRWPGVRLKTPTKGRTIRPEATKRSSTKSRSGWGGMSTRECLVSADFDDKSSVVERNCTPDEARTVF